MKKKKLILPLVVLTILGCNKEPEPNPEDSLPEVFIPCNLEINNVEWGHYPSGTDTSYPDQIHFKGMENGYFVIKGKEVNGADHMRFYFSENPKVGKFLITDSLSYVNSIDESRVYVTIGGGPSSFHSISYDTLYVNKDINDKISVSFCSMLFVSALNTSNIPDLEFKGNLSE